MIKALYDKLLQQSSAVTFAPCLSEDITTINDFLVAHQFATIPQDYADFLGLSDGLIYDGLEFMGTVAHPRPAYGYTLPDLISLNRPYSQYEYFRHKLVIGRISENFMIYDSSNQLFALVDRVNLNSRTERSSFAELFAYMLNLCRL